MATITTKVCDFHEDSDVPATATRNFSVDGREFELDLCDDDNGAFDAAVLPWVEAAMGRKGPKPGGRSLGTRATRSTRSTRSSRNGRVDAKAVREWAAANGIEVASMGKISAAIIDQYKASSGKTRRRGRATAKAG